MHRLDRCCGRKVKKRDTITLAHYLRRVACSINRSVIKQKAIEDDYQDKYKETVLILANGHDVNA